MRDWDTYVQGFGDLEGNFWLGLDRIHWLTSNYTTSLNISLEAHTGGIAYAHYGTFSIGSADTKYKLDVSSYSGTAGNSMLSNNGQEFSTYDEDNDLYTSKCAEIYAGGWWYNACGQTSLNGVMPSSSNKLDNFWYHFQNSEVLSYIRMEIVF